MYIVTRKKLDRWSHVQSSRNVGNNIRKNQYLKKTILIILKYANLKESYNLEKKCTMIKFKLFFYPPLYDVCIANSAWTLNSQSVAESL